MDVSRGSRRPPVLDRIVLAGALGLGLVHAVAAQPAASLIPWLRAQAAATATTPAEGDHAPVLAPGPESQGAIPPGSVIGEVHVVTRDIFDPDRPGEDRGIFRLANKLHRTTRAPIIERQLLFRPGDVFSPELVEESARLLRTNDYLYDVEMKPVLRQDGKVDVEVVTRDVWTLNGGLSFGRAGGVNTTSFSVEDSNLLGWGKTLAVARIGTVDRTSNLIRFEDPNFFSTRLRLFASYAQNSDGGRQRLEVERPFFSLDSRWAAGARLFRDDRLEQLYKGGKLTTGFRHLNQSLELYGGFSRGLVNGTAQRWQLGFTIARDDFSNSPAFPIKSGLAGLGGIPEKQFFTPPPNRALAYPWVRFESIQDRFVVEKDLDRIERSEDLNLGRQWHLLVGYSSPTFGGIGKRWIVQGAVADGWRPTRRQLVLSQLGISTRWFEHDAEDLVAGGQVRWYVRNFGDNIFFASLGADLAHRLDGESQLLLGGDSGLRGYPLRYESGDRRVLLTLEQRFFSNRELFHLVHPGAAIFFDIGRAWFVDSPASKQDRFFQLNNGHILKDVGLGLRLGSSRSARGAVVHLDVAYPLDRSGSIQAVQWLVSTRDTF